MVALQATTLPARSRQILEPAETFGIHLNEMQRNASYPFISYSSGVLGPKGAGNPIAKQESGGTRSERRFEL